MNKNNNCKHQNESGNFCSQCGVALKEKCSECGEMERIGRVVCETKIEEAKKKKKAYIQERDPKYFKRGLSLLMWYCSLGFVLELAAIITKNKIFMYPLILWMLGLFAGFFIAGILDDTKGNRKRKELELEFLQKFPEYSEILKQSEEKK